MTATRIQEIREEIDEVKEQRTKAKARIEDTEHQWKEDYDISSLEESEKLVIKLEKEVKSLGTKETDLEERIEELLEEMDG